jgi:hypothetical protein
MRRGECQCGHFKVGDEAGTMHKMDESVAIYLEDVYLQWWRVYDFLLLITVWYIMSIQNRKGAIPERLVDAK